MCYINSREYVFKHIVHTLHHLKFYILKVSSECENLYFDFKEYSKETEFKLHCFRNTVYGREHCSQSEVVKMEIRLFPRTHALFAIG